MKTYKMGWVVVEIFHTKPAEVTVLNWNCSSDEWNDDNYLLKVFKTKISAKKWAKSYTGHQSTRVKSLIETI